MKKLFTIACPVILATLGVALLFIIRKKRKEKRLKRLRGEAGLRGTAHGTGLCPKLRSLKNTWVFVSLAQMPRVWPKC